MSESDDRQMFKAVCSDCGSDCEVPFQPEEGKKVRCLDCFRKSRPRNEFRRRNNFSRPREMHSAVCAECKAECQVPFKPVEGKPVLCSDCFRNKKNQNQEEF